MIVLKFGYMVATPFEQERDASQANAELASGGDLGVHLENTKALFTPDPAYPRRTLDITAPEISRRLTVAVTVTDTVRLEKIRADLEDLFADGKITAIETAKAVGYLNHQIELLGRENVAHAPLKENIMGLTPGDRDKQFQQVEPTLRHIETSLLDFKNPDMESKLGLLRSDGTRALMMPEVRKEVDARLAVYFCAKAMQDSGGKLSGPDRSAPIADAATELTQKGLQITPEVVQTVLKDGIHGLQVPEAWDELQRANHDYAGVIREMNRKRLEQAFPHFRPADIDRIFSALNRLDVNFAAESNPARRDAKIDASGLDAGMKAWLKNPVNMSRATWSELAEVDPVILPAYELATGEATTTLHTDRDNRRKEQAIKYLEEKCGGGVIGARSLEMAQRLATATFETAYFNRGGNGRADFDKMVWIGIARRKEQRDGGDSGSLLTIPLIPELPVHSFLRINSDVQDRNQPLLVADIDPHKVARTDYERYCGGILTAKYGEVYKILTTSLPDLKDLNSGMVSKWYDLFGEVDKVKRTESIRFGKYDLGFWAVVGVLEQLRLYSTAEVNHANLGAWEKLFVTIKQSDGFSYMTKDSWKRACRYSGVDEHASSTQASEIRGEFAKGFFGGLGGGGGGKDKRRK
jgi:hypothetical protein